MNDAGPVTASHGREAFGTACGLAVVSGALSIVAPVFDALTATLVALAVAAWASVHRRGSTPLVRSVRAVGSAFALLGVGVVVFVDAPPPTGPWRALLLGFAVVPLWAVEQRPRARGGRAGAPP